MIRVKFEYNVQRTGRGEGAFSYADAMPVVPRVGDYIYLPQMGGEFKVRKVIWLLYDGQWKAHIQLRKPFTSEF